MREALPYLLVAIPPALALIVVALGLCDVEDHEDEVDVVWTDEPDSQVEIKRRPGGGWVSGGKPNSRGFHRL